MQFIFVGATPLFDYEFYGEGFAREANGSVDLSDTESSEDDSSLIYLSKRDVAANNRSLHDANLKQSTEDVECGDATTVTEASALRKRPTSMLVIAENEKHQRTMSDELKKKIAEVQQEPVILTQGV